MNPQLCEHRSIPEFLLPLCYLRQRRRLFPRQEVRSFRTSTRQYPILKIIDVGLISKFTVSTTSHQHVRIANASLELPPDGLEGVSITPCVAKRPVVVSKNTYLSSVI